LVDVRDAEAQELLERILEELRALRDYTARQNELLEAILQKLDSLERSQYG
jgi:hypothetical protein